MDVNGFLMQVQALEFYLFDYFVVSFPSNYPPFL